jgi:hypothetical protein
MTENIHEACIDLLLEKQARIKQLEADLQVNRTAVKGLSRQVVELQDELAKLLRSYPGKPVLKGDSDAS